MMRRPRFILLAGLFWFGLPVQAELPPPAGGAGVFGAAPDQAFKSDAIFTAPAAPVPALGGDLFPEDVKPAKKIWKGSVEAGLNGASGNTDLFNLRLGLNADRNVERNQFHTDFLYTLGNQQGKTIQNVAILNARDEILFAGSPWTLFGATNIEYDELRSYKFRIGLYAGAGYIVVNDEVTLFKLRAGAGAVREIGGPADRWVPEMVFGYDLKHKFSDRQSVVSTLDYYPRIDNFAQFRVRARAAYEIIVDPTTGTAIRLGMQSRYDSDPGPGFKRNDLNYFATLARSF